MIDQNRRDSPRLNGPVRIHKHVIYFFGPITDESAIELVMAVDRIEGEDIVFKISSGGGSVHAGIAMYHAIRECGKYHKTTTIGEGLIGSAATFMFQAGQTRIMRPYSHYLIHPIQGIVKGPKHIDIEDAVANLETYRQDLHKMFCSNKLNSEQFDVLFGNERFLSSEETLNYGLCDIIS